MKYSDDVDIYPVGLLSYLLDFVRTLRMRRYRKALKRLRHDLRYIPRQARAGNWRAVHMDFNGYLAEHHGLGTRAGHGWTKSRAYWDLIRHIADITDGSTASGGAK